MAGCCYICVETGQVGLRESWGAFDEELEPGCSCLVPCMHEVRMINLRVQTLNVRCESKTLDNVFVQVEVSVQYRVVDAQKSFYKLDDSRDQIKAYVFDVIRSEVPKQTLDQVFEDKAKLSDAVEHQLTDLLTDYGFAILATPVTDIDPNANVKRSLNQMNEQRNLKEAMKEKAESDAIVKIRNAEACGEQMRIRAEADAEAKYQAGIGLSRQRKAIVDGLSESVQLFQEGVQGVDAKTVMDLIMITQYFDMMEKIGCSKNKGTNALFIPSGNPGGVDSFATQLRQGMMEANAASAPTRN